MQKTEEKYWVVNAYYYRRTNDGKIRIASANDIIPAKSSIQAQSVFENGSAHVAFIAGDFKPSVVVTPLRGFYFDPDNPPG